MENARARWKLHRNKTVRRHDDKAGALGSVYDIGRDGMLNHRFEVVGGVMESECAELMREFFRTRRGGE